MADMRKSKFTEEQIIGFLKQAEAGMAVAEKLDFNVRMSNYKCTHSVHKERVAISMRSDDAQLASRELGGILQCLLPFTPFVHPGAGTPQEFFAL